MERQRLAFLANNKLTLAFSRQKPKAYFLIASFGLITGFLCNFIRDLSVEVPLLPVEEVTSPTIEPVSNRTQNFFLPNSDITTFVPAVVNKAIPTVVKINTTRTVKKQPPTIVNEPLFQWFLGENSSSEPEEKVMHSLGSGFAINANGQIITNAHVVEDADKVTVSFLDGRSFDGKVLGIDTITDIAVVQIPVTNLPYLKLANSDSVQLGEWAIAIGHPQGYERTVSLGIISGVNRSAKRVRLSSKHIGVIQTDATINPGNSGGPLLNANGEVIGVNSALIPNARRIGFAIPINTAKKIAQQLITKGQAEHPYFGLRIQPNNNLKIASSLPSNSGVLITNVVPHSPAYFAGLRAKDIIRKINNQPVNRVDVALRLLENSSVGEKLPILVQRKRRTLLLSLKSQPLTKVTEEYL